MPILKAVGAVNVETEECMSWVFMVCWSKLCCEILLLLNLADNCLLCRRLYIVQCSFSGAKCMWKVLTKGWCIIVVVSFPSSLVGF